MVKIPPPSIESVDSGSGTLSSGSDSLMSREVELRFLVRCMEGYEEAEEKAIHLAPLYYSNHRRSAIHCRPVGNGWYQVSATYRNAGVIKDQDTFRDATGDLGFFTNKDKVLAIPVAISVDTTGATELITQAWSDSEDAEAFVGKYPDEGQDTFGAVNVSGNQVNGVNVTVPAFNWTETWLFTSRYLVTGEDAADGKPYIKTLHEMTGKVNSDEFRIFSPGEVLFLGARLELTDSQQMVKVTLSFSARLNREDFFVGDVAVAKKNGWDYMWVQYETPSDGTLEFKKPRFVYVDRVYEYKSFEDDLKLNIRQKGTQEVWPLMIIGARNVNEFAGYAFTHPIDREQNDAR